MNTQPHYEVRLSRVMTGIMVAVAGVFVLVGIALLIPGILLSVVLTPLVAIAIAIFFILLPLLVVVKTGKYFLAPPVLMRIDKEQIQFATGLNYTLKALPTSAISRVRLSLGSLTTSNARPEQLLFQGGVRVEFVDDGSKTIPWGMVTSAGVAYQNKSLLIKRLYANQGLKQMQEGIKQFVR